jgi:predicted membrane protein
VSGASDFLDPVEAAQDEISRSKRVIASALDDLSHHHSWLETYHREERRRAQRLRRRETLQALKHKRQRAAWRVRRVALTSFVAMRTTALFLARNGTAFLAWGAPRAQALATLLARELSAATVWSWQTARHFARKGYEAAAIGFVWFVRASDVLGIAFRKRLAAESARLYAEAATRAQPILQPAVKRATANWTRTRLRAKRFTFALQTGLTDAWLRTRYGAPILARRSREGVVDGFVWTVHTTDALGVGFRQWASAKAAVLHAEATIRAQPALKRTSAGWAHMRHRSKRLVSTVRARTSNSWARTQSSAPVLARNAIAMASVGRARLADGAARLHARSQHLALTAVRIASDRWAKTALEARHLLENHRASRPSLAHRALVVRKSTALACIEPLRARLPTIRPS